jgi:hypothetical protein
LTEIALAYFAWSPPEARLKASVQAGVLVNAGYFPNLDALVLSLGFALLVEMILGQYKQRMDSRFPARQKIGQAQKVVIASEGDETATLLAAEPLQQPWSVEQLLEMPCRIGSQIVSQHQAHGLLTDAHLFGFSKQTGWIE